jgi:hypothetical protein
MTPNLPLDEQQDRRPRRVRLSRRNGEKLSCDPNDPRQEQLFPELLARDLAIAAEVPNPEGETCHE